MPFEIAWENRPNSFGRDERVAVLFDANNRLEVAPALGFNAYRWMVGLHEVLYCSPTFFTENRPTRGGFPILFPFPNRIRSGRFTWAGKTYVLPINDPANLNAIHGFACQRPWRVVDQGADNASAWITAEFQGSIDAPEAIPLWPADYQLAVTYRLSERILRVDATVRNPGNVPLPFGLGFHPFFALAPFGGAEAVVSVGAGKFWELVNNLPTGEICDIDEPRDLRHGRVFSTLHIDDVLTDRQPFAHDQEDNLDMLCVMQHPRGEQLLTLWASPDFREWVIFTPPHREAICLEPYTCITDAMNLRNAAVVGGAGEMDTGLRMLEPGESWNAAVEAHLSY